MKRPNMFIIGAPKCGTTALAEWLGAREDVFFSYPKEPWHFCHAALQTAEYRDRAAYEALFADARDEPVIAEGSVVGAFDETAVPRILAYCTEARFVMALRRPADLVLSWHRQLLRAGAEDEPDIGKAWALSALRQRGEAPVPSACRHPMMVDYQRQGALGSQLRRLHALLPRDRLFLVWMDDLQACPDKVLRGIENFLGLASRPDLPLPVANSGFEPHSLALHGAIRASAAWAKASIGLKGGTGLIDKLQRRLGSRKRYEDPRDEAFKAELVRYFDPEVALLEDLTGRCLDHWRAPQ